jgi:uncharacterized repeat protein (TIGR01451 family)
LKEALDSALHAGVSASFNVVLADDIAVRVTPSADPTPVGQALVFSITVSNAGPNTSTGVLLTNTMPANATYVSSSTDHGTVSVDAGVLSANIGALTNGEVATLTLAVFPNGLGAVTNVVVARRDQAEPYLGNNAQTNRVTVVDLFVDIQDVSLLEGHSGTTNALFRLSLSAATTQSVSVAYTTTNLIAVAGVDYQATNGVVVFAPGVTNATIAVPVFGDRLNEEHEQFRLDLSAITNASFARSAAFAFILNDDPRPMISATGVSVLEGRNGFASATFTFTLSAASGLPVSFNFTTADDTASADDYLPTNQFMIFEPGQTVVQATVLVQGDGAVEADEQFLVLLYNADLATFADAEVRGTIINDDSGSPGVFDYFDWSDIPSPQTIGRSINVTITARDGVGAPFLYNGMASLTALAGTNLLALSPTNVGPFVDGVWSGPLILSNAATNVVLVVDDGAGHTGVSDPFDVNIADMTVVVTAPPQVLIASPFNYTLGVSNGGPSTATAIALTNTLPLDVMFIDASASSGGCVVLGGTVVCDLGTLSNGQTAAITISVNPLRGGPLMNQFRVAAFEFDPLTANNLATQIVEITGDEDADALPDFWENQNGLSSTNPFDANQDPDMDGHTSLQEYIAGTNPTNALSVLRVTALIDSSLAEIRFRTVLDKRYVVERAAAPHGPWFDISGELLGDGDVVVVLDFEPIADEPRFYRVRVVR